MGTVNNMKVEHMKGQGALVIILAVFAIAASFSAGYFYMQTKQSAPVEKTETEVAISETPATNESTVTPTPTQSDVKTTVTLAPAAKKAPHTAVVVFEPPLGGEFEDKSAIQLKVVNPFLDYYADEYGEGYLVSLAISQNTQASKAQYPYLASAIFKNGGNSGFVISKNNGVIQYWAPDCMKCTFSASFKATYPDIVKNFE